MKTINNDIILFPSFAAGQSRMTYELYDDNNVVLYVGSIVNLPSLRRIRINDIVRTFVSQPDLENLGNDYLNATNMLRKINVRSTNGGSIVFENGTTSETIVDSYVNLDLTSSKTIGYVNDVPLYDSLNYNIDTLVYINSQSTNPRFIVTYDDATTSSIGITGTFVSGVYHVRFNGHDLVSLNPNKTIVLVMFQPLQGQTPFILFNVDKQACRYRYILKYNGLDGAFHSNSIIAKEKYAEEYVRKNTIDLDDVRRTYNTSIACKHKYVSPIVYERENYKWKDIYTARMAEVFDTNEDIVWLGNVTDAKYDEKTYKRDKMFTYEINVEPIRMTNVDY